MERKMSDLATEAEVTQLMSVVGSLSWVSRQCRPDLSYRVSRLQSRSNHSMALVSDLREADKVVNHAI